jgi:hypothetical protein
VKENLEWAQRVGIAISDQAKSTLESIVNPPPKPAVAAPQQSAVDEQLVKADSKGIKMVKYDEWFAAQTKNKARVEEVIAPLFVTAFILEPDKPWFFLHLLFLF